MLVNKVHMIVAVLCAIAHFLFIRPNAIGEFHVRNSPIQTAVRTDENGIVITPVKVMVKGHPAVGQRNEAMRHLQSLLAEFGLTPASISKVSVTKKEEDKNDFAKAFG